MVTHTLSLESTALDQDVLCVTTVLPSYLFVFRLNRLLGLSLARSKEDLKLEDAADSFAVYEYDCVVMQQSWRVIENHVVSTSPPEQLGMFDRTEQRRLLFPALSQTDLLICVNDMTENIAKKIRSISRVISCSELPNKYNKIKEKLTF
jgi:hypothetical protein